MTLRRRRGLSRASLTYLFDVAMAGIAFPVALGLRVGREAFGIFEPALLWGTPLFMLAAAVAFRLVGFYQGVWRYASVVDLWALARAASLTVLLFLPALFLVNRLEALPRSVPVIAWFVLMAAAGGPRLVYRLWKDRGLAPDGAAEGRIPVLLVGAGDEADGFIRALSIDRRAAYRVVGILEDKPGGGRIGRTIHGVEVMGDVDGIDGVVARLVARGRAPRRLLVARPTDRVGPDLLRRLLAAAETHGMTLARLPSLTAFADPEAEGAGGGAAAALRPVPLEDLLGRPQVALDRAAIAALVAGRRVLVTGAGGSIGGELVRQIATLGPARLALLDNGEHALWRADLDLAEAQPALPRGTHLADVTDAASLARVFALERPELVFHAAAYKHVPLVEANRLAGLAVNVLGTVRVQRAAAAAGARALVLISTDKAVRPASVMGASKRLAEAWCQAADAEAAATGRGPRCVTVRFGNVLGSTGSVVPLFERQLARGGPLTVTHPDVARYFMTVREAVLLVLQATAHALADPGSPGRIHVLDMGEPVKIVDLARQMIRLAGLRPERDVQIVFTGLRPGEKLFEALFSEAEPPEPSGAPGVLLARPAPVSAADITAVVEALEAALGAYDERAALAALRRGVPDWAGG